MPDFARVKSSCSCASLNGSPSAVPWISTMPPDVLQKLPKMPEELEYRFVGRHLVILDTHSHLIADFVTNAIPQ